MNIIYFPKYWFSLYTVYLKCKSTIEFVCMTSITITIQMYITNITVAFSHFSILINKFFSGVNISNKSKRVGLYSAS